MVWEKRRSRKTFELGQQFALFNNLTETTYTRPQEISK